MDNAPSLVTHALAAAVGAYIGIKAGEDDPVAVVPPAQTLTGSISRVVYKDADQPAGLVVSPSESVGSTWPLAWPNTIPSDRLIRVKGRIYASMNTIVADGALDIWDAGPEFLIGVQFFVPSSNDPLVLVRVEGGEDVDYELGYTITPIAVEPYRGTTTGLQICYDDLISVPADVKYCRLVFLARITGVDVGPDTDVRILVEESLYETGTGVQVSAHAAAFIGGEPPAGYTMTAS